MKLVSMILVASVPLGELVLVLVLDCRCCRRRRGCWCSRWRRGGVGEGGGHGTTPMKLPNAEGPFPTDTWRHFSVVRRSNDGNIVAVGDYHIHASPIRCHCHAPEEDALEGVCRVRHCSIVRRVNDIDRVHKGSCHVDTAAVRAYCHASGGTTCCTVKPGATPPTLILATTVLFDVSITPRVGRC